MTIQLNAWADDKFATADILFYQLHHNSIILYVYNRSKNHTATSLFITYLFAQQNTLYAQCVGS